MKTELVIRDFEGNIEKQSFDDAKVYMYQEAFQIEVREVRKGKEKTDSGIIIAHTEDAEDKLEVVSRLYFPTSWLVTIRQFPESGGEGSEVR